jgi:Protein of unknown function (DUF3800)
MASTVDVDLSRGVLPVCLVNENSNGLESLWWAMQHSEDPNRQAAIVTLYLDESATDDSSPVAVVGGLLLNKSNFLEFDPAWRNMLKKHSLPPPLHMKDFRRPKGRLADIPDEVRRALFVDAVELINKHKIYSIAGTLATADYRRYFDENFIKKGLGLYGACFILCAQMSDKLAKQNDYKERIPFLMDSGNPYADHVRGAHAAMQERHPRDVGALSFDKDEYVMPLQAADVIAWASRVRARGDEFTYAYEPLVGLFNGAHAQEPFPESARAALAADFDDLRRKGESPV